MATNGAGPRRDTDGQQICELCPARISRVKHHRPHGLGRACQKHAIIKSASSAFVSDSDGAAASASASTASRPQRKRRRAESDPGEQSEHTPGRLRVRAIKAVVRDKKKQKQEKEAAITALLDAAHARRVAAMALEQLGVVGVLSSSSSSAAAASSSSSNNQ